MPIGTASVGCCMGLGEGILLPRQRPQTVSPPQNYWRCCWRWLAAGDEEGENSVDATGQAAADHPGQAGIRSHHGESPG